nr:hypothetical protein [Tanacetum cinerariifolium]
MAQEYAALMRNSTWSIVSPIPNANVVDCKWVYKFKRDQTGAITRYKARLVAKGFNQQQGIDYFETFSPVVKSTTILMVLSLVVTKRWTLQQLDVQNAFLHGELHTFSIQDLGTLSYSLGVEVVYRNSDVILSQKKYILELLQRVNFSKAKPVPSPITTTANLHLDDSPLFDDPVKYRQLVGALQYVTLSRPDITYAMNKVFRFINSPTINHWSAVKRILRYFRDVDWADFLDDQSEYKALADIVAELTWIEALLRELKVPMTCVSVLWHDNLGATYLLANPVFHARTKHVEVDFHFVREKVAARKLFV